LVVSLPVGCASVTLEANFLGLPECDWIILGQPQVYDKMSGKVVLDLHEAQEKAVTSITITNAVTKKRQEIKNLLTGASGAMFGDTVKDGMPSIMIRAPYKNGYEGEVRASYNLPRLHNVLWRRQSKGCTHVWCVLDHKVGRVRVLHHGKEDKGLQHQCQYNEKSKHCACKCFPKPESPTPAPAPTPPPTPAATLDTSVYECKTVRWWDSKAGAGWQTCKAAHVTGLYQGPCADDHTKLCVEAARCCSVKAGRWVPEECYSTELSLSPPSCKAGYLLNGIQERLDHRSQAKCCKEKNVKISRPANCYQQPWWSGNGKKAAWAHCKPGYGVVKLHPSIAGGCFGGLQLKCAHVAQCCELAASEATGTAL
jgi:hypothetical protein